MSPTPEQVAAQDVRDATTELNRSIDRAILLGLRVDITTEMQKVADSPRAAPHITTAVVKRIDPEEQK